MNPDRVELDRAEVAYVDGHRLSAGDTYAVTAVEPDGSRSVWLTCLDDDGMLAHPPARARPGPGPCGRPTARGRPCRVITADGRPCRHHQLDPASSITLTVDELCRLLDVRETQVAQQAIAMTLDTLRERGVLP